MNIFDRIEKNKERVFIRKYRNFFDSYDWRDTSIRSQEFMREELQEELERALRNNNAIFVLAYYQLIRQGFNEQELNIYDVLRKEQELKSNNNIRW